MPNLDSFSLTTLANGDVTDAFRGQVEGVFLDDQAICFYDGTASDDRFTPKAGWTNPFVVDDLVWVQNDGANPRPGGVTQRRYYVVDVAGDPETIQLSTTQGGSVVDLTSDGSLSLHKILADYTVASGGEILMAMKTNIVGEMLPEDKEAFKKNNATFLLFAKARSEGIL